MFLHARSATGNRMHLRQSLLETQNCASFEAHPSIENKFETSSNLNLSAFSFFALNGKQV